MAFSRRMLCVVLIACAPLLRSGPVVESPRPNVLLIVADDHGTDALGCYGNPAIRTPHLDALAREGIRFTQAFCTTSSCSPSRSVILTGLQGHHNGMYGLQHQVHHFQSFDTVTSLPQRLAKAGYRTGRVGKFHLAPESVFKFETVLSGGMANDPESIGRSPVEMVEAVHGFLTTNDPRPFFLYFATDDPHRANAILPNGRPTFATYPKPNRFGNRPQGYPGITPVVYTKEEVIVPPHLPDTPECRSELAEYYQSVSRLDQGVGQLLESLKASGKYDNTLIIYISDNGQAFPGAKTTLYDPGIRLPCIIRSPRQPRMGIVEDAMISWVDLAPTILDFVGAPQPKDQIDGRSFRPALEGGKLKGWDEVYASHNLHEITMYYPMRMVRTRRYKLIWNIANGLTYPSALDLIESPTWISAEKTGTGIYGRRRIDDFLHRPRFELYDLQRDPDEVVNLADDPASQAVRNELIAKLKAFQSRTQDPWINKWNYE
ncbi:MAG: sulfatase [Opitutaceae bacterium]|nr:sulfatase [Opitutaceae bacterium]